MLNNSGFEYKATIRGRIIPVAWSSDNRVTRVSIWTANDTEFVVEATDMAAELNRLVRQEVVASGQVWAGEGDKRLTLDAWELLTAADDGLAEAQPAA